MMSLMGRGEPSQGLITSTVQSATTDDKTTVQSNTAGSQSGNESSGLQTGVINSCLQTGVSSSGLQTGVISSGLQTGIIGSGSVSGVVEDIGVICPGSSQSTESRQYNPALRLVHCNLHPTIN